MFSVRKFVYLKNRGRPVWESGSKPELAFRPAGCTALLLQSACPPGAKTAYAAELGLLAAPRPTASNSPRIPPATPSDRHFCPLRAASGTGFLRKSSRTLRRTGTWLRRWRSAAKTLQVLQRFRSVKTPFYLCSAIQQCSCRSKERTVVYGTADRGSNPLGSTKVMELWQTWCMRRTEASVQAERRRNLFIFPRRSPMNAKRNPKNVVQFREAPQIW